MQRFKQIIAAYFTAGITADRHTEVYRRMFVVNLFSFVGMSITAAMATSAAMVDNYGLSFVLYVASVVYILGYVIQRITHNTELSSSIIIYSLFSLMLYLVYAGGVKNTGPLWIFMVSPVALFIHGFSRGLTELAIFLGLITIMMFVDDGALIVAQYDFEFKTRLVYSFLTVTFLSGFYEYSREQSFKHMVKISNEFESLAKIDSLTKLSNRRDALHKLKYEYNRMLRTSEPVTVLLCDVDYFKKINDTYGHEAGDQVLVSLAETFNATIRSQDTVARWGGEEFLFVLPQTNLQHSFNFSEKIHQMVRALAIEYKGQTIQLTLSIGAVELNKEQPLEESIHIADEQLYLAKNAGRNQTRPKL